MLSLIGSLIGPVSALLDKAIPDKDLKEKLAHEIATMAERQAHETVQAQLEINKTEAAHPSLFVSGWRPATGWVCVFGMAFNFILTPFTNMALELSGSSVVVPMIDMEMLLPVLLGMLGLGAMRTVEKIKKVERKT
jgi:hypothetical protein|tara:strand:+ start:676 stop:1083 length:408 start_codon:yes stop_codon:yes gene_type:complete